MTPKEISDAYALAKRPYIEAPGPTPAAMLGVKSWRYVLEINSQCNLRCALCHAGNRSGYDYKPGVMDMGLMERILDKIKSENPSAVVCCYVNSEPFLHPHIAECVASIKRRGLRCEFSTNGNYMQQLDQVLAAKPDLFTISVSGFTQEIYERSHRGGDIEKVKANIKEIVEANIRGNHKIHLGVSYHMYEYNLHEVEPMRQFTVNLGAQFLLSWGRSICIENTVQALRHLEKQKTGRDVPYRLGPDGQDLNTMLPPAKEEFLRSMEQLRFHPEKARGLYERFPVPPVCIIADVFTEIRHDGKIQLCSWTDDMRLTIGNYLDMTQDQISAARRGHPLCDECLRYRLPLYFHLVDCNKWDGMNNVPTP
jgi:MoaA/NifB/PqqE/SkfB family radical SAM enzyme